MITTQNMKFGSEGAVNHFIRDNLEKCNRSNMADLMSTSVKVAKENKRISHLKKHLPVIAEKLLELSTELWKFRDISAVVYGLQFLTEEDKGSLDIVEVMADIIESNLDHGLDARGQDISSLFMGLQRMNSESAQITKLLSVVALVINQSDGKFTHEHVTNSFYGLLKMNSVNPAVRDVLSALTNKMNNDYEYYSAQELSLIFLGLQGMCSDYREVRETILILADKLRINKDEFTGIQMSKCLKAMRGMSSDQPEVRDLLSSLLGKARSSSEVYTARSVANALYGMKRMSSDCREVREILSHFAKKLRKSEGDFNDLDVSNAFEGLEGMSSDRKEVREALAALVTKMRNFKDDLSAQALGNSLCGLQGMNSDSLEVQDVLYAIAIELRKSKDRFTTVDISNAFYGMQGMSNDNRDVQNILSVLSTKVIAHEEALSFDQLGNILYGLQGINSQEDNEQFNTIFTVIIEYLSTLINRSIDESTINIPTKDMVCLKQSMIFISPNLQKILSLEEFKIWENINEKFTVELKIRKKNNDLYYNERQVECKETERLFVVIQKVTQSCNVDIIVKGHLFDVFESDFILKIPNLTEGLEGQYKVYNIEIDGMHLVKEKKKLFCNRKDEYLISERVSVLRISSAKLSQMNEIEIENWLLKNTGIKPIS
jgi:hypothetical protein